ncbi:MAG: hypothetical protein ACLFNZ_06960 [Spirochaetaceae bacterium]
MNLRIKQNRNNTLTRIYRGYADAIRGFMRLLLFLLFVSAVTLAISLPLWYWALHSTASFTVSMLMLFALGTGYFLYSKAFEYVSKRRKEGCSYLSIIKGHLKKAAKIILLLLFLYFIASLVASSRFIIAFLLAAAAVVTLGFLFFAS